MRPLWKAGVGVSFLLAALGAWLFLMTRDAMLLIMLLLVALFVWAGLGLVHVVRHGLPVRVVERPPPKE